MMSQIRKVIDRLLNKGILTKIAIVTLFSFIVFLGSAFIVTTCFDEHIPYYKSDDKRIVDNDFWQLYYYFADPGNQMSANGDDSSRWIGLIISTLGSFFLSGLLISTFTSGFERMADKWRTGFSYYKLKNHIVIIGSDQMVYGLVRQLCERVTESIVVMTSADVEQMRNSLWASLKNKKDKNRIIVNYGQRDSENFLRKINIAQAKEVYVLGDISEFDDIESYHDSLNVKCITLIAQQCKEIGRTGLRCHVLFDYKTTYHIFQYANLNTEITKYIDFHPFNFYDSWAKKVLVAGRSIGENILYKPLDYCPITTCDSDKFVHFIIIGMSKMGQAMALQAAHIAHFPNYKKRKTKITMIDCNGGVEMNEFKQKCGELFKVSHSTYIDADAWLNAELSHTGNNQIDESKFITEYHIADEYKHLVSEYNTNEQRDFIDIEWEFIKGYDHNPVVQRLLAEYIKDKNAIITVAVCLNITHISLRSAMHLPKAYYEDDRNIPILVQQRKTSIMASTLNGNGLSNDERNKLLYKNVVPFGMVDDCYDLHLASSVEICKRISATYDHYFTYGNYPVQLDQKAADELWNKTIITKRWSNIFAAASIPTKLRCIGINWDTDSPCPKFEMSDDEVDMIAEIEHNRWNIEELLLGYRPVTQREDELIDSDKAAKDKCKERFIHYDIRPYTGLKEDKHGRKAYVYDKVIVKSLPLILNYKIEKL